MPALSVYNVIEIIQPIAQLLDRIESLYNVKEDITLKNMEFDGSTELLVKVENSVISLTHETASQIGFNLDSLKKLLQYIKFRSEHPQLTALHLEQIIDHDLTAADKKEILDAISYNNKEKLREGLQYLTEVKVLWNKQFLNKGFKDILAIFSRH